MSTDLEVASLPAPISPAAKLLKESGVPRPRPRGRCEYHTRHGQPLAEQGERRHPDTLPTVLERFSDPVQAAEILDAIPEVHRG